MVKKILGLMLVMFLAVNLCGCAAILVGAAVGAGAVCGYAVSKDTIQGDTDKAFDSLWSSAGLVAASKGDVKFSDQNRGYIEVQKGSLQIWIRIIRMTSSLTRVRVSARKLHLPDMALAQEVFARIIQESR